MQKTNKKTDLGKSILNRSQKIFLMGLLVLFFLVGFGAKVQAATYYVDSSITDTNIASATPDFTTYNHETYETTGGSDSVFKTIADVNAFSALQPGDNVYFRKGQTWREQLIIPASGEEENPITLGAFGSGNKPNIYGSFNWGQFTVGSEVNILSNGSFETYTGTPDDGVDDTMSDGDAGQIVTIADPNLSTIPDGDHALMLWDNGSNDQWRYRNVPVTAGQWYAIRFYGMSDGTGTVRLSIKEENGQGYYSTLDFSSTGYRMWDNWQSSAVYREIISNSDTSWTQKEYLFKIPDNFTGNAIYLRFENIADNSKAYVDNVEMFTPKWVQSGSEYKIMTGAQEIDGMHYSDDGTNWTLMTEDTAGSLSSGEWDWDSSTGYLHVYLPSETPSDYQIEGAVRYWDVYADSKSYTTTDGFNLAFARTDGWHIQGAGTGNILQSSTIQFNNNDGVNIHGSQTDVLIDSNSISYNGDGTTGGAAGDGVSFHESCTGIIQNNIIEENYKAQIDNIDASTIVSRYNYLKGRSPYTVGSSATGTHTAYNNIRSLSRTA